MALQKKLKVDALNAKAIPLHIHVDFICVARLVTCLEWHVVVLEHVQNNVLMMVYVNVLPWSNISVM